jgi:hypothetical protein
VPALSATSLNFGTQTINTKSAQQNIVFSNSGTDPLGIGGISVNNSSYVITKKTTCGSSVAPGGSCTIAIAFKRLQTQINGHANWHRHNQRVQSKRPAYHCTNPRRRLTYLAGNRTTTIRRIPNNPNGGRSSYC